MGIRDRKQLLINLMKVRAKAAKLSPEHMGGFEMMYRRARSAEEQDQVTRAFEARIDGWQTNTDALAVVRRGFLEDDEDEDPPSLVAALERSRVRV